MDVPNVLKVILLGKTGVGKSSLGNTILGQNVFRVRHFLDSQRNVCQSVSGEAGGRSLMLVDTPGFFDPGRSEKDLRAEILQSVSQCGSGPHAFVIVLQVEKFTEQEQDVIKQMEDYFSPELFRYSVVVFTHGDQLSEDMKIEAFIKKNHKLTQLVEKCKGGCFVVDSKYWNNKQDDYKNNKFQVSQLVGSLEELVKANGGNYTTDMLERWEKQNTTSIMATFTKTFKSWVLYVAKPKRILCGIGGFAMLCMLWWFNQIKSETI